MDNRYSVYKLCKRHRYGFPMILHDCNVKNNGAYEIILIILNLYREHSSLISTIKIIIT